MRPRREGQCTKKAMGISKSAYNPETDTYAAVSVTSGNNLRIHVEGNTVLLARLETRSSPVVECASDLHEILNKLADVGLVHSDDLVLVRSSEAQTRNEIQCLADEGRDDEDIGAACTDVGKLDVELLVVALHETAGNGRVDFVEGDDVVGSEDSVEEEPNNACDAVFTEQIEGVVDTNPMFD